MITDIFDSANFASNKPLYSSRANVTLLEHLIFRQEPLNLSGPQLIDGYFVDLLHQDELFSLIQQGLIQINLYHPHGKPINSITDYLNMVLRNEQFFYSSMPKLMELLKEENALKKGERYQTQVFQSFRDYLSGYLNDSKTVRPLYDNGTLIAKEMNCFERFIRGLLDIPSISEKQHYNIVSVNEFTSFNAFLKKILSCSDAFFILGLADMDTSIRRNYLNGLFQCKDRSELEAFYQNQKDYTTSEILKRTRQTMDVIYNIHALMHFQNAEINVIYQDEEDIIFTQDQKSQLNNVITAKLPHTRIHFPKKNVFYYANPNIESILNLENALDIRKEIDAIHREKQISWQEAVEYYFGHLRSNVGVEYNDFQNTSVICNDLIKSSIGVQDMEAKLKKADQLALIELLKEQSYYSK